MSDIVDTAYGRLSKSAVLHARTTFDLDKLLRCVEEYRHVSEYLSCEVGPRDSLPRLYHTVSTVLRGSAAVVPPGDGDLPALLSDVLSDLQEAVVFFQSCIDLIEPLQRLPDPER